MQNIGRIKSIHIKKKKKILVIKGRHKGIIISNICTAHMLKLLGAQSTRLETEFSKYCC